MKRRLYRVELSREAEGHLAALSARDRAIVLDVIERQLVSEPTVETRNRKPMDPDKRMYIAPWELRVESQRVYYAVREQPEPKVVIVAIGVKQRDRVRIGGEWVEP